VGGMWVDWGVAVGGGWRTANESNKKGKLGRREA